MADCLVPEPRGLSLHAATCVGPVPGLARSSMYLPPLSSIPEAAEHNAADLDDLVAAEAAVEACFVEEQPGTSGSVPDPTPGHCSSDCSSGAGPEPTNPRPDVLASSWAISIRHFTDCVPISADSVCSNSTCHAMSLPSSCQVQAADCGNAAAAPSSNGACVLDAAGLQDLDVLEVAPWDHVAAWLGAQHAAATPAAATAFAFVEATDTSTSAAAAAASASACSSQQDTCSSGAGEGGSDCVKQQKRHTPCKQQRKRPQQQQQERQKQQQQHASQQQQQQQGQAVSEPQWDAPLWWQESVQARLEEQREAFHSSWWCRFKFMTGFAAQRAARVL